MNNVKKIVLAATASTLLIAGVAIAKGPMHDGEGRHGEGYRMERLASYLQLTDEQQNQINDIMEQYRADFDPEAHKAEREAHRSAMQELMHSDNFDEQAARDMMSTMQQQRVEHQVERMKMQHEILAVLTPEQQALWQEARQGHRRGAEGEHRGGMQGGHRFDQEYQR